MLVMNNLTLLDLSSHDDGLWQGRRPWGASQMCTMVMIIITMYTFIILILTIFTYTQQ